MTVGRNSYGGIHLWSTGANGGITDTTFYGNTVYMSQSGNGNPVGVDCSSEGIRNIRFYNNRFHTDGKADYVRGQGNQNVVFKNNTFETQYKFPRAPIEV